jgi:hypothetical protein
MTLWSFAHGILTLERANLLSGNKTSDVSAFGTDLFFKGLSLIKTGEI